jgi:hypothetical protein
MNSYAIKLKAYFDKQIFVDKDTVLSNGVEVKDGSRYLNYTVKEGISGNDVKWAGSDPRLSFLEKVNRLSHNRNTPIFKAPAGDTPHLFIPNMKSTQFESQPFQQYSGPLTVYYLFRPRKSVQWEGGAGVTLRMRNRGDAMAIDNTIGEVILDKGLPVYDRWNLLAMESNGDKSRAILNGVQIGGFKTLPTAKLDRLYIGNPSHTMEHDFKSGSVKFGLLTDQQHKEVYALHNKVVPILSLPEKPVIYDIKIGLNANGYYLADYKYHSPNDVPIDPGSLKVEWITGGDLDKQTFIGTGQHFDIVPKQQELAAIVSCKDRDGKYYTGIPFRSEFLKDQR